MPVAPAPFAAAAQPQVWHPQAAHPQAAHPHAQQQFVTSTGAPQPPASRGGSGVGIVVLGLIGGFIAIVAVGIVALSFLGSTVEESFEQVVVSEQPAQGFEPGDEAEVPAAEAIVEPQAAFDPAAEPGVAFVTADGNVSMTISPKWDGPVVEAVGDFDFTRFEVPEFSRGDYQSRLDVWNLDDRESTFEVIAESQAFIEGMEIQSFRTRTIDGDVVGIVTFEGGRGDVEQGALLVIHKTETGYARALLVTPIERFAEASLTYEAHLLTVRFTG